MSGASVAKESNQTLLISLLWATFQYCQQLLQLRFFILPVCSLHAICMFAMLYFLLLRGTCTYILHLLILDNNDFMTIVNVTGFEFVVFCSIASLRTCMRMCHSKRIIISFRALHCILVQKYIRRLQDWQCVFDCLVISKPAKLKISLIQINVAQISLLRF